MFLIQDIILKSGHEPVISFTFLDLSISLGCFLIIYIGYIIFKSIWLDIQPNVWFVSLLYCNTYIWLIFNHKTYNLLIVVLSKIPDKYYATI